MPGHYGGGMKKPAAKKPAAKKPAAKKLSPKQKTIARKAGNPNKIEGADLKALRAKKKKM